MVRVPPCKWSKVDHGNQIADKKDKHVNFDVKIGNLFKTVKYHWLLSPSLNQEGSAGENLNWSQSIFF